jgi:hypothetical protein
VYRNTRAILEYIQSCGYGVQIPENAREGAQPKSFTIGNESELVDTIQETIAGLGAEESVGILCDHLHMKKILDLALENITKERSSMRIMTKTESQGVEFNSVISINSGSAIFEGSKFESLLKIAQRNADYIGYTRAVEKLFVITLTY